MVALPATIVLRRSTVRVSRLITRAVCARLERAHEVVAVELMLRCPAVCGILEVAHQIWLGRVRFAFIAIGDELEEHAVLS